MSAQFKKGVLEICVLAKISVRDMYGYEIVQSISETIEVNEGTIYPILRRLTKENYFETYMKESTEGPARKYYRITDMGRTKMIEMVREWRVFSLQVEEIIKEVEGA
ncbi:MAG: PadR family transcriptional regulator [Bacilli bacterium]